jgi:hypothetical protein
MVILKSRSTPLRWFSLAALSLVSVVPARGQTCLTGEDMDAATQAALTSTAKKYFDLAARSDSAELRQNATPGLAANFSGIETAVKDNTSRFAGAAATARSPFMLKAEGAGPLEHAEFLCGVFGPSGQTAHSAVFQIPNLPPGNYGFVTLDVASASGPDMVSFVLEQQGAVWKLAGFYVREARVAGHDGNWFSEQARAFKSKGQFHNAWFYYLEARSLLVPVDFMSVRNTDRLYDEAQSVKPSDLPPIDLAANGKTYKLIALFPMGVGDDLDLVVKHRAAGISDTIETYKDNVAVIGALVSKYPEFRDAFTAVVARAVEASGRDYGTMMMMKDIK